MAYRIWSSLPLDVLRQELLRAGISPDTFSLTNSPKDLESANVLFGSLPKGVRVPPKAQWFQLDSSDTRNLENTQSDIKISNLSGVFADAIAESVLGSLLGAYRGLFDCARLQQYKKWAQWDIRPTLDTLAGKQVIILGGGAIAKSLVKLLLPFQCAIIIYRRKKSSAGLSKCQIITDCARLDSLWSSADVIVNTLPASEETKGFLNSTRIKKIRKGGVFVNVGRGSTVDQDALVQQSQKGHFRWIILDVTNIEPLDKTHTLWDQNKILLTQHTFGGHKNELAKKCQFFADNFKKLRSNAPLLNQVK